MAAVFATGWTASLRENLGTADTVLPIRATDAARLCNILGNDHTYLVLTNGVDVEIVKAECFEPNIVIERGATPIAVPAGGCVSFEVTEELLADYVIPNNAICSIEGVNGIFVEQDGCEVTLTLGDECDDVRWRSGNTEYWLEDGCIKSAPMGSGCVLVPGTYKNATITVTADGLICSIEQGSNIVYSDNPCCADCAED